MSPQVSRLRGAHYFEAPVQQLSRSNLRIITRVIQQEGGGAGDVRPQTAPGGYRETYNAMQGAVGKYPLGSIRITQKKCPYLASSPPYR